MKKSSYVLGQKKDGQHTCHWPGCPLIVSPALWGCKTHWFRLPAIIRVRIWQTYVPGQEIKKNPSEEYLAAAKDAQDWITSQVTS